MVGVMLTEAPRHERRESQVGLHESMHRRVVAVMNSASKRTLRFQRVPHT